MKITLLGSGDAIGMPVPLCGCDYCRTSDRRRRPSLLVETADCTLVLDAGPDLAEQLRTIGVKDVDAVFLTHVHHDHIEGLHAIAQAGKWPADHLEESMEFEPVNDPTVSVYLTATALEHLREMRSYLLPMIATKSIAPRTSLEFGDAHITPFAVEHARPTFETIGFVIECGGSKVVYAPDVERFRDYETPIEPELLFIEGAALFGTPLHGSEESLRMTIEATTPDQVVLLTISEHKARKHTEALGKIATASEYELGADFATYSL